VSSVEESKTYAAPFAQILNLFLSEPSREEVAWNDALNWKLPNPQASVQWLKEYNELKTQAQASWDKIIELQKQVDEEVANWYGFNSEQKRAIAEGLPWARRRRPVTTTTSENNLTTGGETTTTDFSSSNFDQRSLL
jgi:hypothetical protein